MGGNMRMFLLLVMISWMIWSADAAADVCFTTKDATEDTYNYFMKEVRDNLASGKVSYGIPVLRPKSAIQKDVQRFLLVKLTSSAGESITLALDVVTGQLVAYQATDDRSFFFKDAPRPQSDILFRNTDQTTFKFTGSYADLTGIAEANRSEIPLGMKRLSNAIQDVHAWSEGLQKTLARGLLVIIQMVPEAAKITYNQLAVTNRGLDDDDFTPDCAVISFEDNWGRLSNAILTSENGKFGNPVELQRGNCKKYNVTELTDDLRNNLALLKSNLAVSRASPVISSAVADEDEENIDQVIMAVRKFNPGRHTKWLTIQA